MSTLTVEAPERQLVAVERVASLTPIENADAIESAQVRGWNVVVKKGEVSAGDEVLYFELDSFLPLDDERFAFLAPRSEKVIDGVRGHVLKTARLRGVYSQGLILPARLFPELATASPDDDLAALLGITKFEPPIPAELADVISGAFPTTLAPRTGAERIQNLTAEFASLRDGYTWVPTEKVDGTSITYLNDGGTLRVCGRNWEYSAPENPAEATAPWKLAYELGILSRLPEGFTVQGELFGEGVLASNPLKIKGHRFVAFSVLEGRSYVPRDQWPAGLVELAAPVYDLELPATFDEVIAQADGIKSLVNPAALAEGIVWHTADGSRVPVLNDRSCFKAISNKWLLKHS